MIRFSPLFLFHPIPIGIFNWNEKLKLQMESANFYVSSSNSCAKFFGAYIFDFPFAENVESFDSSLKTPYLLCAAQKIGSWKTAFGSWLIFHSKIYKVFSQHGFFRTKQQKFRVFGHKLAKSNERKTALRP